jgi:hypothetical protein
MGPRFCHVYQYAVLQREGRITYCGEAERVDLNSERRNILLLELSGQMALDEGRLRHVVVSIDTFTVVVTDQTLKA